MVESEIVRQWDRSPHYAFSRFKLHSRVVASGWSSVNLRVLECHTAGVEVENKRWMGKVFMRKKRGKRGENEGKQFSTEFLSFVRIV